MRTATRRDRRSLATRARTAVLGVLVFAALGTGVYLSAGVLASPPQVGHSEAGNGTDAPTRFGSVTLVDARHLDASALPMVGMGTHAHGPDQLEIILLIRNAGAGAVPYSTDQLRLSTGGAKRASPNPEGHLDGSLLPGAQISVVATFNLPKKPGVLTLEYRPPGEHRVIQFALDGTLNNSGEHDGNQHSH